MWFESRRENNARRISQSWSLHSRIIWIWVWWIKKVHNYNLCPLCCFSCVESIVSMAIRVMEFSNGGTKLERFLPKNQFTQRKLLNFENWVNGEVSKSAKSPNLPTFKVNFLYQKLSESFSIFFSLKNINLGAHFLVLTFFDSINF